MHTKHWLPGIFKKPCKTIYSKNMENSNKGIYLLSAVLCSFQSLDDNTTICHRKFSPLAQLLLFQSRKLCVYIPSPLSRNPQHMASCIHLLLTFVNAVNKNVSVGRFRVPAAGANATRKTARWRNWFSRNHHVG